MAEGFPDRPGYSFDPGPPPEASRYLRNKGFRPGFSWADVEPEEHAVAFSVAKAMELDLLEAMRGEVQKALDQGLPFEAFAKSWRSNPKLADWCGRREMVDPVTGERVEAQLGSPRRLRTIYNANLRTARAAGQWERIERTKAAFPFLEYRTGPSETHRKHHLAKAGLILPVEAAFWDEWMPPNGWGCKCWVRQVTAAEAKRRGISAEPEVPDAVWENERSGERRIVPQGIDPGWQRNPGKLRLQHIQTLLVDKLEALPEAARVVALRDIATSWFAERMLRGEVRGIIPIAALPAELQSALGAKVSVVRIRDDIAAKIRTRHPEVTTQALAGFAEAILSGPAVREDREGGAVLQILVPGDTPWRMVIKHVAQAGELWISTIHRVRPDQWQDIVARPGVTMIRG